MPWLGPLARQGRPRQKFPGKFFPGNPFRGLHLAATLRGALILGFPLPFPAFAALTISVRRAALSSSTLFKIYATSAEEVCLYILVSTLVAFSTKAPDH